MQRYIQINPARNSFLYNTSFGLVTSSEIQWAFPQLKIFNPKKKTSADESQVPHWHCHQKAPLVTNHWTILLLVSFFWGSEIYKWNLILSSHLLVLRIENRGSTQPPLAQHNPPNTNSRQYDQGLWKPLVSLFKAGYSTLISEGAYVGGGDPWMSQEVRIKG